MAAELWAAIAGWEGVYEISTLGRVKRLTGSRGHFPGKILNGTISYWGYPMVVLKSRQNGMIRGAACHRLMAEAFLGPIPEGMEVNHRDGIKTNNQLENLELVTRQGNIDHACATGLINNKGERNSQSKLTAAQVIEIRNLASEKVPSSVIASRFKIRISHVRRLVTRKQWVHVQ